MINKLKQAIVDILLYGDLELTVCFCGQPAVRDNERSICPHGHDVEIETGKTIFTSGSVYIILLEVHEFNERPEEPFERDYLSFTNSIGKVISMSQN